MELKLEDNLRGYVRSLLLIVPYGIETKTIFVIFINKLLLIVPYGIETQIKQTINEQMVRF